MSLYPCIYMHKECTICDGYNLANITNRFGMKTHFKKQPGGVAPLNCNLKGVKTTNNQNTHNQLDQIGETSCL